jgi:hypothetical protein
LKRLLNAPTSRLISPGFSGETLRDALAEVLDKVRDAVVTTMADVVTELGDAQQARGC